IVELNDSPDDVIRVLEDAAKKSKYDSTIENACDRPDFYHAGFSKYFLIRLELVNSEFENPKHYTVKSVEHVLPQTLLAGSDWCDWFDEERKERYVHNIGNLVLLSKGKNSSASNKPFSEKKSAYLKDRVSAFPRSIQVLDYEKWTQDDIIQRTQAARQSLLSAL
ncbi:HNH endonuclease family protein, partial [Marinicauda pacifica]|uniref:HNH endonuclease family protein n=1 Tax=Marinicauda pacifica TaxID=1133559 RepID=UPI0035C7FD91